MRDSSKKPLHYLYRRTIIARHGFITIKRHFQPEVERILGKKVVYRTLRNILAGIRVSGPLSREIMEASAKVLKMPIEKLWPEVKSKKAA